MLTLTNLSNADCDVAHILHGDADALPAILQELGLQAANRVRLNGEDRVVVMVDGVRLNNDRGAPSGRNGTNLQMFPSIKSIKCIAVVKGGRSVLLRRKSIRFGVANSGIPIRASNRGAAMMLHHDISVQYRF